MAEATIIKVCECAQCGVQFEAERKRKYCSQRCNWNAASRRKGKRPIDEVRAEQRARTHRECPECKRMFRITRHDGHSHGPQIHCGNKCAQRARHKIANLIARERDLYRAWSLRALGRTRAQINRDEKLRLKAARRALLGSFIRFVVNPKRPCQDCGSPIGESAAVRTFCYSCGDDRKLAQRRAAKAARRAKERSAVADRFDPIEIFERDGWRCHMCGCKTPRILRGTYRDNAPELDHIVTLAEGGSHTRTNVACACRKCNITKGGRSFGQLILVA